MRHSLLKFTKNFYRTSTFSFFLHPLSFFLPDPPASRIVAYVLIKTTERHNNSEDKSNILQRYLQTGKFSVSFPCRHPHLHSRVQHLVKASSELPICLSHLLIVLQQTAGLSFSSSSPLQTFPDVPLT